MARLSARERDLLPESAFAYVDSRGKRRLPVNDAAHVRAALARFGQVRFEDDRARERSRKRLLKAAKRHGIVPIGFITSQLREEREQATAARIVIELGRVESSSQLEVELRRTLGDDQLALLHWSKEAGAYLGCDGVPVALPAEGDGRHVTYVKTRGRPLTAIAHAEAALADGDVAEAVLAAVHLVAGKEALDAEIERRSDRSRLPDGVVTFLLTDIEGSTAVLEELGDGYAGVLDEVRDVIRAAVLRRGGREVEARADEFVAVFADAAEAVAAAAELQRSLGARAWPSGRTVRVRAGLHTGEIALTEGGYVGLTVHAAARVMAAAHGGQVLLTSDTRAATAERLPPGVRLRSLGPHPLRGLAAQELLQIEGEGLIREFPPMRPT